MTSLAKCPVTDADIEAYARDGVVCIRKAIGPLFPEIRF